ncbi:hypothetical protein HV824_21860 [Myxococcus sp. AM009]|uniref:hypothetical protein n=1 Tax=unclassified Myxococcus TaxID=2648731 RepID=UPI00159569FA|nr:MULTISPECIES: hypothetical protein [unclassified Myxococcus]NVJ00745.1 hypothetical protein [Myxococcus sp. AM009]NVJ14833.1 hypothetical protein [Myxococcus sp. AM010]
MTQPGLKWLWLFSLLVAGCGTARTSAFPLEATPGPAPVLTLVWVGRGEAERLEDGAWKRVPQFDYDFTVEQRRYAHHWESVKSLRRRHPDYDGSAGPREQTMFFRLEFTTPGGDGRVASTVRSSLGEGTGHTDIEFRRAVLELRPDLSRFAPFDRYRITQTYAYERGALEETVMLLDGEKPWVRNTEKAALFAPHIFSAAPTSATR